MMTKNYSGDPAKHNLRSDLSAIGTYFWILILFTMIPLAFRGINGWLWGEEEGVIRTEDCRSQIPIVEGSSKTWFKKFTCSYYKTSSGRIMGGYCSHVEIVDGVCQSAYSYAKKPDHVCTDPHFPNLHEDDHCYQ